jgi:hypothetical protein
MYSFVEFDAIRFFPFSHEPPRHILLNRLSNAQIIIVPLSVYRRVGPSAILLRVRDDLVLQNKVWVAPHPPTVAYDRLSC